MTTIEYYLFYNQKMFQTPKRSTLKDKNLLLREQILSFMSRALLSEVFPAAKPILILYCCLLKKTCFIIINSYILLEKTKDKR